MKSIKYYPYRTGFVRGIGIDREKTKALEDQLYADLNITSKSNHACFDCIDENTNEKCAVIFSDFSCVIGEKVEKRNW